MGRRAHRSPLTRAPARGHARRSPPSADACRESETGSSPSAADLRSYIVGSARLELRCFGGPEWIQSAGICRRQVVIFATQPLKDLSAVVSVVANAHAFYTFHDGNSLRT